MNTILLLVIPIAVYSNGNATLSGKYVCDKDGNVKCCIGHFEENNQCKVCPNGTHGENCTEKCPDGYHGLKCREQCMCKNNTTCDKVTGECKSITNNETENTTSFVWTSKKTIFIYITISAASFITVVIILILSCFGYRYYRKEKSTASPRDNQDEAVEESISRQNQYEIQNENEAENENENEVTSAHSIDRQSHVYNVSNSFRPFGFRHKRRSDIPWVPHNGKTGCHGVDPGPSNIPNDYSVSQDQVVSRRANTAELSDSSYDDFDSDSQYSEIF